MARKEKRLINIGVDLGTSASKVAFRDLVQEETYLVPLRPEQQGFEKGADGSGQYIEVVTRCAEIRAHVALGRIFHPDHVGVA